MSRLILIGCVKTKIELHEHALVATKDLYCSPLFKARRSYAEASGCEWKILSAEHGIINPNALVSSYERRIGERTIFWDMQVKYVLFRLKRMGVSVVEVHAGKEYVDALRKAIEPSDGDHIVELMKWDLDIRIEHPVAGLQIGEQLRWYKEQANV